ncbi:MAG: hypothetical protein ABSB96_01770 [Gaiellaceae bacterium]
MKTTALIVNGVLVALAWFMLWPELGRSATPQDVTVERYATWICQDSLQLPRTQTSYQERYASPADLEALEQQWHARADACRYRLYHPPHLRQWLCIHRGEAAWTDAGAPYWGGLQMDHGFMRAYGPKLLRRKGTADHWTPFEQMWVAERAWRVRSFHPWPAAARSCGLL